MLHALESRGTQIALLRGFKTINAMRRREQAEDLKGLGADELICSTDEDLVERVMAITGGAGVPAAIDAVAGKLASEVMRALSINGVMLVYGLLSIEPIVIDTAQMVWQTWPAGCPATAS